MGPAEGQIDDWRAEVGRVARGVRRRVLAHTHKNNGGYLSQACSSDEILATNYGRVMKLVPSQGPLTPRPLPGVPGPSKPATDSIGAPRLEECEPAGETPSYL